MGSGMFIHCNRKFNSVEVWFLRDNQDFTNRKLFLGTCPICGCDVVSLVEKRKADGVIFRQKEYKKNALKIIAQSIKQVEYTNKDIIKIKKIPFGLCYGENKEIKNSKGKVIKIIQNRCDFFGAKEIVSKINSWYSYKNKGGI